METTKGPCFLPVHQPQGITRRNTLYTMHRKYLARPICCVTRRGHKKPLLPLRTFPLACHRLHPQRLHMHRPRMAISKRPCTMLRRQTTRIRHQRIGTSNLLRTLKVLPLYLCVHCVCQFRLHQHLHLHLQNLFHNECLCMVLQSRARKPLKRICACRRCHTALCVTPNYDRDDRASPYRSPIRPSTSHSP